MFRLECSWQAGGTRVNRVEWLRYPPILPGMIYSLIYLTDEACNFMHRSMRSVGSPWQYNGSVTLPQAAGCTSAEPDFGKADHKTAVKVLRLTKKRLKTVLTRVNPRWSKTRDAKVPLLLGSVLFEFYQMNGSVRFEFFAGTRDLRTVRVTVLVLFVSVLRGFGCSTVSIYPQSTAQTINAKLLPIAPVICESYVKVFTFFC